MEVTMENVCYVCGAVGFDELLLTCTKCKGASIHEYCMKTIETVVPNTATWVCEECEETPKHVFRKFSNEVPAKKKTKIISTDEAIALASQSSLSKVAGKRHLASPEKAYKKVEISKNNNNNKPIISCLEHGLGGPIVRSLSPTRSRESFREISKKRVENVTNVAPPLGDLRICNAKRVENITNVAPPLGDLRVCNAEKISRAPFAGEKRYKRPPVHASTPSSKQKSCMENPAHARTPSPSSKPSPAPRSSKDSAAHAHTTSAKSGLGFALGGTPCKDTLKTSDNAGEERLRDKQLAIDRHLPNHPASSATWKGTLSISGYDTPVGSCNDVWGYPPTKVYRKAFEFSKKMQGILRFEPIPRSAVWGKMFNDRGLDNSDIGLYFLPNGDRSEHCYSCLVSYLEKEDIVLRSFISGVQLLIFSSLHLDEESKKINQAYYLWGLFLPPVITRNEPAQNQLPSVTNPAPAVQQILENQRTAGMETDVPIPGDSHPSSSKRSKAAASASQPASEIQVKPEKWDNDDLACVEPRIPPGFEKVTTRLEPSVPPGFERVKFKTISEILQAGDDR